MRFGICAAWQDVAALQRLPFDYLEENVQRFLMPEQPQERFEEALHASRALPVAIEAANSLLPPDLTLIATATRAVETTRLERYIRTALRRAEQAGIQVIVFGSGGARACPPGYFVDEAVQQIGEHLATWCTWAQPHGVRIALEPLRYEETNTLNTVTEAGTLVARIVDSGATLLADIYHMACNGEPPDSILPWASLLSHVHVAEKEGRTAPGQHKDDFRRHFSVLHQAGYDNRISIECNWHNLAAEVDLAISTLREQWAASTS